MISITAVLAGLCDFPKWIQNIFVDFEPGMTPSCAYLLQIQIRGRFRNVLVDDWVPCLPEKGSEPCHLYLPAPNGNFFWLIEVDRHQK
jgi:hypothetical protein